jgi:hypothetical protein
LTGNGAYEGEMNEVATFMTALRAAVPTQPDPSLSADLIPRLAKAARAATIEEETRATRRHPRPRLGLLVRIGIALAAVPLLFAGLAVAGVTVPEPARNAFEMVGIELPNQPSTNSSSASNESPADSTAKSALEKTAGSSSKGNSHAAHQHALQQHQKAKGKAIGHTRGKAIGLNELTPPGKSGDTGPPDHSNAGGSSQSAPTHFGHPGPPHPPNGISRGHGR